MYTSLLYMCTCHRSRLYFCLEPVCRTSTTGPSVEAHLCVSGRTRRQITSSLNVLQSNVCY